MPEEFGFLAMFSRLANDDITKYEQIEDLNYILCLNQLSLWKYQDEIKEFYIKQMNKK